MVAWAPQCAELNENRQTLYIMYIHNRYALYYNKFIGVIFLGDLSVLAENLVNNALLPDLGASLYHRISSLETMETMKSYFKIPFPMRL